ncbi:heme ABC transporter ATP-binding protein [Sphingobacterium corticibacter]|uniref:Heme ABC transporter ATP-binding protein n=1 Tax=Sphingobacterium corticibacter TaxID=2171749 RepID=A0A2T8HHG6_9SPHI|nr:heme ABC transporter ATP-binding protein [Sphingobacterium corticibacter]PVH24850.1 heme ABC transporter ATP-binding protein [Sphingobacterium corticibacter]
MIEVKNLSYQIGNKPILRHIDMQARPGELLAMIGPNGAGKSTLMKLLCGEVKSPQDSISLHGKTLSGYKSKELALMRAVLTQANEVSVDFSVQELVTMGRYPHFEVNPSMTDLEIIEAVLEEMGIQHFKDRSYHSLSGGEKQRVQLARVLAQIYERPDAILFLDEPINGLDIQYQQIILEKAKKMAAKGWTVLCVLHDINFASKYADKILILKAGEVANFGTPTEIITAENMLKTYNIRTKVWQDPEIGYPFIVPTS